MFGLFNKCNIDESKVDVFVKWFFENSDIIISSVDNINNDRQRMLSVLDEVEKQLALIYRDCYKGRIEFDYGGKDDDWELNLYHKNKPFLIKATTMIADKINSKNSKWTVNTGR